jgi:hypothetical protein
VYGDIARREMNDLDLLVPRDCLERAAATVGGQGFTSDAPLSIDGEAALHHHLTRFIKGRAVIELHWNIAPPRRPDSIDPASLFERSVPLGVPGSRLRALAPEDLVLHLCSHAAYQHWFEFGMRSLCDVTRLLERDGATIDWTTVVRRAQQWGWTRGVYLALDLARELLGAQVPAPVFRLLDVRVEDEVRAAARDQVLAGYHDESALSPGLSELGEARGVRAAVHHVRTRVFLPVDELRQFSGGDAMSRRPVWWLYLRRAVMLVKRDAVTTVRLLLHLDSRLSDAAHRRQRLLAWLGITAT